MEQPSILSSLRSPMATATVEPAPPDRLGGLGSFSPVSPTEERSPDAVSSASEATEGGQSTHFIRLVRLLLVFITSEYLYCWLVGFKILDFLYLGSNFSAFTPASLPFPDSLSA